MTNDYLMTITIFQVLLRSDIPDWTISYYQDYLFDFTILNAQKSFKEQAWLMI